MKSSDPEPVTHLQFDDNQLLPLLFGEHDKHLVRIEKVLKVTITARGNIIKIVGKAAEVAIAESALKKLYQSLQKGHLITNAEIDTAVRLKAKPHNKLMDDLDKIKITTRKRVVYPRSIGQAHYIEALATKNLVFAIGPAGTGKTYLAVATAVEMLLQGKVDRIILSRPAVEAGEKLGFLPGALQEKIDPYLRPLYDALYEMLPADQVIKRLENGEIEVAALAFMRGRTLSHSFVILDEAQNTTITQIKMFLTRLGDGSNMVVTGDLTQIDLLTSHESGLKDAIRVLSEVDDIGFIHLKETDSVRHPLVNTIIKAYG